MIRSFKDRATEDIHDGQRSSAARRRLPLALWPIAQRKLDQLDAAAALIDLAAPPGNRLEPLRGDRIGQYSVRINDQYRLCFFWTANGPESVEIADYH
jgi:proteic killer suppression protein